MQRAGATVKGQFLGMKQVMGKDKKVKTSVYVLRNMESTKMNVSDKDQIQEFSKLVVGELVAVDVEFSVFNGEMYCQALEILEA